MFTGSCPGRGMAAEGLSPGAGMTTTGIVVGGSAFDDGHGFDAPDWLIIVAAAPAATIPAAMMRGLLTYGVLARRGRWHISIGRPLVHNAGANDRRE